MRNVYGKTKNKWHIGHEGVSSCSQKTDYQKNKQKKLSKVHQLVTEPNVHFSFTLISLSLVPNARTIWKKNVEQKKKVTRKLLCVESKTWI